MDAIDRTDAKAHLSDLISRAEADDWIDIIRRSKPFDATLLRSLTTAMPFQLQSAADLVRSMRDNDRY